MAMPLHQELHFQQHDLQLPVEVMQPALKLCHLLSDITDRRRNGEHLDAGQVLPPPESCLGEGVDRHTSIALVIHLLEDALHEGRRQLRAREHFVQLLRELVAGAHLPFLQAHLVVVDEIGSCTDVGEIGVLGTDLHVECALQDLLRNARLAEALLEQVLQVRHAPQETKVLLMRLLRLLLSHEHDGRLAEHADKHLHHAHAKRDDQHEEHGAVPGEFMKNLVEDDIATVEGQQLPPSQHGREEAAEVLLDDGVVHALWAPADKHDTIDGESVQDNEGEHQGPGDRPPHRGERQDQQPQLWHQLEDPQQLCQAEEPKDA
mmetsp:Transcript_102959/g.266199  ORF Transcript_102959/g.266199 Transcript_102959/m.266199 type:complete len:319 (+) Transcript_102959:1067-2023(+)